MGTFLLYKKGFQRDEVPLVGFGAKPQSVHLYIFKKICLSAHGFKNLVGAPEEVFLADFFFKTAALEHFRNGRVYA